MMLFQVIEFFATFIEAVIGILFTAKVEGRRKVKWQGSAIAALVTTSIAWVLAQYQLFSIVTSIVGIMGIAIGSSVAYKLKLRDAMIASVSYMLLIYITDFFAICILGILFREDQFAKIVTEAFSLKRVCLILLTKSLLIIAYFLIKKINLDGIRVSIGKIWLGIIAFGTVVFYFVQMTFQEANIQILVIWCFLIILAAILVYSCSQYTEYMMAKRQMDLTARSYENLIQNYRDNQIYCHDLKNHYAVIKNYLASDNYEEAKKYFRELERSEKASASILWTGIEPLDILLECKKNEAETQGISVTITADQLHLKATEHELVALFGNAFDNAIESCKRVDEGARWIRVAVRKVNEMTLIKISNSYKDNPETKEGGFLSLKNSQKQFGWGIASMQTIVEKYDGTMDIQYENGQFDVQIMFYEENSRS